MGADAQRVGPEREAVGEDGLAFHGEDGAGREGEGEDRQRGGEGAGPREQEEQRGEEFERQARQGQVVEAVGHDPVERHEIGDGGQSQPKRGEAEGGHPAFGREEELEAEDEGEEREGQGRRRQGQVAQDVIGGKAGRPEQLADHENPDLGLDEKDLGERSAEVGQ